MARSIRLYAARVVSRDNVFYALIDADELSRANPTLLIKSGHAGHLGEDLSKYIAKRKKYLNDISVEFKCPYLKRIIYRSNNKKSPFLHLDELEDDRIDSFREAFRISYYKVNSQK